MRHQVGIINRNLFDIDVGAHEDGEVLGNSKAVGGALGALDAELLGIAGIKEQCFS